LTNVPLDYELDPLHIFRFKVTFKESAIGDPVSKNDTDICSGAFSECTGLEATMEPKVIKEGGRNYGPAQRAGQVTFSTVILKRGITTTRHLWQWWELFNVTGAYKHRMQVTITLMDAAGKTVAGWQLDRAMPIKFKSPDLNAKGTEVGIEELHLAHEGLRSLKI
jgi:phage tail-like protein